MKIKGKSIKFSQLFFLAIYYGIAQYLPNSYSVILGRASNWFRVFCVKHIFKKCGRKICIERKAFFASGVDIEIGDYSGIGINAHIPNGTIIGNYVMMGPNCFILDVNHNTSDVTIPMCKQGMSEKKITRIGNDVWIGRDVHITPGRTIADGSIVAMGCVLTKDFPPFSVIGGNPSRLLKNRNQINEKDFSSI